MVVAKALNQFPTLFSLEPVPMYTNLCYLGTYIPANTLQNICNTAPTLLHAEYLQHNSDLAACRISATQLWPCCMQNICNTALTLLHAEYLQHSSDLAACRISATQLWPCCMQNICNTCTALTLLHTEYLQHSSDFAALTVLICLIGVVKTPQLQYKSSYNIKRWSGCDL